jgi:hypothetical protein
MNFNEYSNFNQILKNMKNYEIKSKTFKKSVLFGVSICISFMLNAQVSKTVNITTAGTLSTALTENELSTVANLTVTGNINDDDFFTIRDKCIALEILDIGGASVVGNSIPYRAFYGCAGLSSIILPEKIDKLENSAFQGCSSLTEINIPNSVRTIGNSAFKGCIRLELITIPSSVNSIEKSAFSGCSGLNSVVIPSSVKTIGDFAFNDCINLTTATTPFGNNGDQWYTISSIFTGCPKLKSIIIPEGLTTIKDLAFANNFENIISLTIPSSVTYIGENAFYNCNNLSGSLVIPSSTVGKYAFFRCNKLDSVTFTSSVTSIGIYAFYECSNLTSATIPASVTSIGALAFGNCTSLITATTPFGNDDEYNGSAFDGCTNLTKIIIPDGLTSIKGNAFSNNFKMVTSVSIPASVTKIEHHAFYYCTGLSSLIIPSSVNIIEDSSFSGCSSLTGTLIFPNSVNSIGSSAFANCSSLNSIIIPSSITTIASNTFANCNSLDSIQLPASITTIGPFAFSNCKSLISAITPFGNDVNNKSIFSGCDKLTSIIIPEGVITIKADAFSNNFGNITSLSIPGSVISIRNYAFSGCKSLTSLIIPSSVNSISHFAFENCTGLDTIYANSNTPVNLNSSSNVFNNVNKETCKLYVPFESYNLYAAANQWKDFYTILEMEEFKLSATTLSIPAIEGSTVSVDLTTELSWTASSDQSWITLNSTSGTGNKTFTFTAGANYSNNSRTATITISAQVSPMQTLSITQQGLNKPPIADAGPDQTVNEGESVTLDGSGSYDPDNDPLTYQWTAVGGITLSSEMVANPTFIAPEVTVETQFIFTLAVNDGIENSESDQVIVTVQNVNTPPIADAGPDQTVNEGESVTLDGSGSSDSDNDPLTYQWTAAGGIILSSEIVANPTFIAPEVTVETQFIFTLAVNDGIDNSEPDQVIVTVQNVNTPPIADAGPGQTVNEGETVTLDGSGSSDPDGNPLTFFWTFPEGIELSSESAATPTFTAPEVSEDTDFTFTLLVNDDKEDSEPDEVVITVLNVNKAPVADAGPDQTVNESETVTLDGSGSTDPDGDPLTFYWNSPEGIELSSETAAAPTFTAPEVSENMDFTFTLVVNDGTEDSGPDEVVITVLNVNKEPVAIAGPGQTVNEGETVMLDGTGSYDPDGDEITYQWTTPDNIALNAYNISQPSFVAPKVYRDTVFKIILTVFDGIDYSLPAEVEVFVNNVLNVGSFYPDLPEISIYPNPAAKSIIVLLPYSYGEKTEISIYNLLGKTVFRQVYFTAGEQIIDISDQMSGIYLVHCTNIYGKRIKKLIINKKQ